MFVVGLTGWKNSGKTTLTAALVTELTRRGLLVSTVKHAHHDADVDHAGTDTMAHRLAGAGEVALVTARRWALMHECRNDAEPTLDDIIARLSPCDIVLVEGFKSDSHPKIELRRTGAKDTAPLAGTIPNVVAIATDHEVPGELLPVFPINDVAAIADFVIDLAGLHGSTPTG
jgi:molybdopterin-guanine dinucleotide biosynthesis adapter protein